MTFYYHFKDIYDLVEWSCLEDARSALQGKKTSSTWHEGDTLAQTVDKEDISSRADINHAKKSTVMDSYLALSGKTINTLKQDYSEYESENYRIVPDNEAECFDIYDKVSFWQ